MSGKKTGVKIPGLGKDLTLKVRCKDCKFHKHFGYFDAPDDSYKTKKVPCEKLGVPDNSKPCPKFSVDPHAIDFEDVEGYTSMLQKLMYGLKKKDIPLFSALINQELETRKRGFIFGQTVYIKILSGEYLSNFARGRVITANKDYVHLQGEQGFRAMVFTSSVLTEEQFEKRKKLLQKEEKLLDPQFEKMFSYKPKNLGKSNYKPKSITKFKEDSPELTNKKGAKKGAKKGNKGEKNKSTKRTKNTNVMRVR